MTGVDVFVETDRLKLRRFNTPIEAATAQNELRCRRT